MKKKTVKLNYYNYYLIIISLFGNSVFGQSPYNLETVKRKADSVFSSCEGQAGCAVGVMHNNKLVYQNGYGYSNMDLKTSVSPSTVFEVGTLSMHFTAAGIMLLEDAGKLSLDDEIQKYLPEIPVYKEGKITLRHLLTHSSGLRDYIVLIMAAGNPLDIAYDNKKALTSLSKQQALCVEPGSTYRFSQSNYTLLAMIIERVSKQSFPQYMQEHLFQPAGMSSSLVYNNPNEVIENRATGYDGQSPNYERILSDHFLANGSSRIMTNVNDFVKWNRFLNEKRLSNQSLLEKLSRVTTLNNGREMTYRFGLEGGQFARHNMIAHNGYGFGFNAMYLHFPDESMSIVAMSNNINISAPGKAYDLAEAILPPIQSEDMPSNLQSTHKFVRLSNKKLSAFASDYFSLNNGYLRRVYLQNDTLRLEVNANTTSTLVPISKSEFTILNAQSAVNIAFEKSSDGYQMIVSIDDREPAIYNSYDKASYDSANLNQFKGSFFSEELGVSYRIGVEGKNLATYVGERKLVDYVSAMENNFTSEHDGYITFQKNRKGEITGFVLSDYSLGSITFTKS